MAIIPDVPGLEATILVRGTQLQEYDDWIRAKPQSIVKYIEAQSAEEFEFFYRFKPPFPIDRPLSTKIFLDGNLIDEPLLRPHEIYAETGHKIEGTVSQIDKIWVVEKFRFAGVTLEGDRQLNEEELDIVQNLGQIELRFYWLENPRVKRRGNCKRDKMKTVDEIPEKAVKGNAISHQAILSEPEATLPLDIIEADYAEPDPFATFVFKYRSIDALKALYIIPRTPSPVPLSQREIHELNDDEVRIELMRLKASQHPQSSSVHIKREREDDTEDEVVYVGQKRLRRLPRDDEEVIALD